MKDIVLKVEGMHCNSCSTRLEKVLNMVDGINSAKVSLEDKEANINFDENQIKIEEIKELIEDAGFTVI